MADRIYNARFTMIRKTKAEWNNIDPVLLAGEIAVVDNEDGQILLKVGNGETVFSDLPYVTTKSAEDKVDKDLSKYESANIEEGIQRRSGRMTCGVYIDRQKTTQNVDGSETVENIPSRITVEELKTLNTKILCADDLGTSTINNIKTLSKDDFVFVKQGGENG